MKAYSVSSSDYEHTVLVFADNANQAKSLAKANEIMDFYDYVDMRPRRAKYADGHENDSERDLMILNIRNGWWYEIGNYHIDADNLEEMIEKGIII